MSRIFKNPWSNRREPSPKSGPTAPNVFEKSVPEVPPELLRNNSVLTTSQSHGSNNNASNSKSRHRQNRKPKSNSNSPNQNNYSKFSPRSDKRRNKSPPEEPHPPLSWPVHPPESIPKPTIPVSKRTEDDKIDTASASSLDSSRSRGSSVSSENKESDRKKTNEDESSKYLLRLCLFQ